MLRRVIPAASQRQSGHPAKRTFQALRIEVNDELEVWRRAIDEAIDVLAVGGRIAVLSYHSLEDRATKRAFAAGRHVQHPARSARRAPRARGIPLPRHPRRRGRRTTRRSPPTRGPPRPAFASPSASAPTPPRSTPAARSSTAQEGNHPMSQMTATARPLRAPRRGPAPTPLRVIPSSITRTGNGAFATMCIALLIAGLIALLLLNTALAQGSLALGDLQRESARLSDTAGNLQEQIDRASATGALARSAAEIGMVRDEHAGLHRPVHGHRLGRARAGDAEQRLPDRHEPDAARGHGHGQEGPVLGDTAGRGSVCASAASSASVRAGTGRHADGARYRRHDPRSTHTGYDARSVDGQATGGAASNGGGQAQQTTVR